jgi:putative tryptophan/tyrosine transport system substrate-binding protein
MMKKKITILTLCAMLFALCVSAQAQQSAKIPRIGYLNAGSTSNNPEGYAFRERLRELGYVEGKSIIIESRHADGNEDRLKQLAQELVGLKVDVIVTSGPIPTRWAKAATSTIPIVMAQDSDPIGNGFVASLARPGGNITGLSRLSPELSGKRLEILKEVIHTLSRLAVCGTSTYPGNAQILKEIEQAAGAYAVKLQNFDILAPNDFEGAFRTASKGQAQAMLMFVAGLVVNTQRSEIVKLAAKYRMPVMYSSLNAVEAGGLMSYDVSFPDLYRRAAVYVDKILKGAKPAELPVEQPMKFEFVINLKAAKQIGLTIPPNVLARADKIIR